MLYSFRSQYPKPLPFAIVLSNGQIRTEQATFTEEELADAGYVAVNDPPEIDETQILQWSSEKVDWIVKNKTAAQIEQERAFEVENKWKQIRDERDRFMRDFDWRYIRHDREVRLGLTPSDDLSAMDAYMQALADITEQSDPFNITWPTY